MYALKKLFIFSIIPVVFGMYAFHIVSSNHDVSITKVPTVFAAEEPPNPGDPGGGTTCDTSKPGFLCNPLQSATIKDFLVKIIEVLIVFAVPIIVIFIMYAGFLFVTARGDASQISTARSALLWAVIGGVIALGAKLIIEVIQGTVDAF